MATCSLPVRIGAPRDIDPEKVVSGLVRDEAPEEPAPAQDENDD